MGEIKQVIVVRGDLVWGKGKLATHVGHAAVRGYKEVARRNPEIVKEWENTGEKKIVVKIENLEKLIELHNSMKNLMPAFLIADAGFTQLEPGTITCMVSGPWHAGEIDKFTGKLKLV